MNFSSIKTRATILLIFIAIIPVIIVGLVSALYYQDVLRSVIGDENLDQAKVISSFTCNYVNSTLLYLESQATRPSVFNAVQQGNVGFLTDTIKHVQNASIFSGVYATNSTGTVISSYPAANYTGRNDMDLPWVSSVLQNNSPYVSDARFSIVTGKPVVYIGVPIMNNNTTVGALVGAMDLNYYENYLSSAPTKYLEYTYIVNRTGHVMVHNNRSYMDAMLDVSDRPGVQSALKGETGFVQQFNPLEQKYKLASYVPISQYGWGVVVSLPIDVAYAPIFTSLELFLLLLALLSLIAIAIASIVSIRLVRPILNMATAAREMPFGSYEKDLPMDRRDELGILARSMDRMAGSIRRDQKLIVSARDQAEEEKRRAELYVDIMSHDINNLNQVALANLEFLREEPGITPEDRDLLDAALGSVRGSADIIENVRKIQNITGEKLELEDVDINDLLQRCIKEAPRPRDKVVNINYRDRPGMYVRASPLLKELFCNLINNSVKYSGAGVTIDINVEEQIEVGKKFYVISIADNGNGIPDDVKPRLFRRFERGTTKAKGKGLGLYIVKMLAERFGGSVHIEDRVPGDYSKGAKFIVTLPSSPGK